ENKNVGNGKTVNVSSIALSGDDSSNYNLTNTTATTTVDIAKKDLGVTYAATNKTYDGTTDVTVTESTDDIVSGDSVNISE
ncbi:MAG: YDG domain-containing protein, partial [Aliarcobacter sp.]|nr:YDG domain-containing protein [Aliarcobacter sp.]